MRNGKSAIEQAVIGIDAIKSHPRNYNRHSDAQLSDLCESLRQFGQVRSIVVQRNGKGFVCVAGHGLMAAARAEGLSQLRADVIPASWPQTKILAYLAADNELARRSNPDEEQLAALVREVYESEGEALARLAAGEQAALDAILRKEVEEDEGKAAALMDKAAELQKKWQVKRGDVWEVGRHRIMCGDSTSAEDVARLMQGEKATIIFADPPYGVSIGAKNRLLNSVQPSGRNLADIESDSLSPDELKQKILPVFVNAKSVVMNRDCTVFVTAPQGGELGMMMMMMMMEAGLPVRHVLIWKKNQPTFSMGRLDYDYQHEPILLTWLKSHKRPMGGQHKTSVWEIDKPRASKEHPTMKPLALVENALLNNSDSGDICFDPFLGSGTTLVACEQTGRIGRGTEIEPKYVAVTLERLTTLGLEAKRVEHGEGKATRKAKARRIASDQAKKKARRQS